jgi:hypothetical protein
MTMCHCPDPQTIPAGPWDQMVAGGDVSTHRQGAIPMPWPHDMSYLHILPLWGHNMVVHMSRISKYRTTFMFFHSKLLAPPIEPLRHSLKRSCRLYYMYIGCVCMYIRSTVRGWPLVKQGMQGRASRTWDIDISQDGYVLGVVADSLDASDHIWTLLTTFRSLT